MIGKIESIFILRPMKTVSALLLLFFAMSVQSVEQLRVGVYPNHPFSYISDTGQPEGFVVGVLNGIAASEGWQLEYRVCTWESCNELLGLGEIDILLPMSANEARQRHLDFNNESLYVNWGQIVMEGRDEIRSPLDLAEKTVVVVSSDTHFADLKELAKRFDIDVRFLEVGDYESVLDWVAQGPVDAGLVNRLVNTKTLGGTRLNKSSVIFNPAEIRVAFSPFNGQITNAKLIQRLDYRLTQLKGDPDSVYYQLQDRWFGHSREFEMPWWLTGVLIFSGLLLSFLAIGIVLLRRQVRIKTASIRELNEQFAAFMDHLPGIAYMKQADGRYLFVNSLWQKHHALPSNRVEGHLDPEIWPERKLSTFTPKEAQAIEERIAVEQLEHYPWGDKPSDWQLTYFPIQDSLGNVEMVGAVGINVTEQRATEQALLGMHQQQQLILESAGDGIIGLNGVGRCTFVNRAALEILSYQQDELVGEKFHDRILHSYPSGEAYPERNSPIFQAHRLGRRFQAEQALFWGGGGVASAVEYSAYPIDNGGLMGAVVIFRVVNQPELTGRSAIH